MIATTTLIAALDSSKQAANAALDIANLLNTHENMIQKNTQLEVLANRAFTGYSSVDAEELTPEQKNLMGYQYDYIMPGANNSFRRTIAAAVEYYIEKPYNQKIKKELEDLCSDRADQIRNLNMRIKALQEQIEDLETSFTNEIEDIKI